MLSSGSTCQWRHYEREGVSYRRRLDCLLNRLLSGRLKKIPKFHTISLCKGNPPVAINAENIYIWWRHKVCCVFVFESCSWKFIKINIGGSTEIW